MTFIEVNQKTCGQDGLCSAVCPAKLINFTPGEYPTPIAKVERFTTDHTRPASGSLIHVRHSLLPFPKKNPVKTKRSGKGKNAKPTP